MGDGVVLAGFWRRAGALFIDLVLVGFLLWMIGLVIDGWSPGWTIARWEGSSATAGGTSWRNGHVVTGDPIAGALFLLYFLVPEATSTRATPGKRMLGLAVAGLDGGPVRAGRAAARAILKLLSCLTFGLGFALAGLTRRKQALHDVMSDCLVVRR